MEFYGVELTDGDYDHMVTEDGEPATVLLFPGTVKLALLAPDEDDRAKFKEIVLGALAYKQRNPDADA